MFLSIRCLGSQNLQSAACVSFFVLVWFFECNNLEMVCIHLNFPFLLSFPSQSPFIVTFRYSTLEPWRLGFWINIKCWRACCSIGTLGCAWLLSVNKRETPQWKMHENKQMFFWLSNCGLTLTLYIKLMETGDKNDELNIDTKIWEPLLISSFLKINT